MTLRSTCLVAAALIALLPGRAAATCADEIAAALAAPVRSGPYRMELTVKGPMPGAVSRQIVVHAPPSAISVSTESEGRRTGVVVIGETVWRDSGQGWFVVPADQQPAAIAKRILEHYTTGQSSGTVDEARCGTHQLDGRPMRLLEYSLAVVGPSGPGISVVKLTVDPATGRPLRQTMRTLLNNAVSDAETLYSYDPALKVEAPTVTAKPPEPKK